MGDVRRLGAAAARNRFKSMLGGHSLPGHKEQMLRLTARLYIHATNCSNRLFDSGEETWEEQPRALLGRLLELQREIRSNLLYCFDSSGEEEAAFARLRGEE